MKKFFMALAIMAVPFMFWSCDTDDVLDAADDLIGSVSMTVDGTSYDFSGCAAYTNSGKTYIAATSGTNTVAITLNGVTKDTYTLGLASGFDITSIMSLISGGISDFENTLTFVPSKNATSDTYTVIAGTCTITSIGQSYIKGTFTGNAVKLSDLQSLSLSILQNTVTVSGSFTGVITNNAL